MTYARTSHVRCAGRDLHVFSWGSGPAVLLVHGWGGRAEQMCALVVPLIAAGHQVIAFDAPAHGTSAGWLTDPIEFTRAIRAVADQVGTIACLIGHSFGAAAALLAVRDWGVQADKLILLSSYSHFDCITAKARAVFGVSDHVLDRVQQKLLCHYSDRMQRGDFSPAEVLRSVECPTLIVHDRDDALVPLAHARQLLSASRAGLMLQTQGYGHYGIVNEETANECVRFIDQTQHFARTRDDVDTWIRGSERPVPASITRRAGS